MTVAVICPFCDKDVSKVKDMAEQMKCKPFPSYFSFHFVDDRKDKTEPVDTMGIDCITYEGNKGTFHARKYGFEHTNSDYVWCVDVDDYIMPFRFEPEDADVVLYRWRSIDVKNGGAEEPSYNPKVGFIRKDTARNIQRMVDIVFSHALWDKVIKRSIMEKAYEDLDFDEKCIVFEDLLLNALVFRHCDVVKVDGKSIYTYRLEREWLLAKKEAERDFFLSKLPDDIKPYFEDRVRNDISYWSTVKDLRCCPKGTQNVTFALNRTCNKRCAYCQDDKDHEPLSDEQIYDNFDKCLSRAERLHYMVANEKSIFPQIKGGEPTLWSDWLIKRIQDRLSAYSSYIVFTNGSNKDSLWYKDDRAIKIEHVIDWHGKKLECENSVLHAIVVCHNELEELEKFLKINDGMRILLMPCRHKNPSLDCTFSDIVEIARLEKLYDKADNVSTFVERCKEGLATAQDYCRAYLNGWEFNCVSMTASPCCISGKKIPVEEFWGLEEVDCGGCMWTC